MKIVPGTWTALQSEKPHKDNIYHLLHDLKTPLYAEQWALRLMEDAVADSPELMELLQCMKENNRHLLSMVHQMLLVPDALEFASISVTQVLMGVLNQLSPLAHANQCRLQYSVKPDADKLVINGNQFRRILTNLVGNAIQHAPVGSCVSIRVRRHRQQVVIQIRDNGCGMPTNYNFEDSYGLTICRTLIEFLGGSIQWRNKEPGTSVVMTLPYSSPKKK